MAAIVNKDKCTGCGDCIDVCPCGAIEIQCDGVCCGSACPIGGVKKAFVNADICADCTACVEVCPTQAISME